MILRFEVPGEPRGKGRPRFSRAGGFVRPYTDARTEAYESIIRYFFRRNFPNHLPLTGPVRLSFIAGFQIPKSASAKKAALMLAGEILPTKKPDASNILKAVEDALNGVAFRDDCQICAGQFVKRYANPPALIVEIGPQGRGGVLSPASAYFEGRGK